MLIHGLQLWSLIVLLILPNISNPFRKTKQKWERSMGGRACVPAVISLSRAAALT